MIIIDKERVWKRLCENTYEYLGELCDHYEMCKIVIVLIKGKFEVLDYKIAEYSVIL